MNKKGSWSKVSKQMCVHKGKGSLLELENCMKPSSPLFPWHIHAQGEEGEEGTSLIRFIMVDYKKKDQDNKSISVYANVHPLEVKYLFYQMFIRKKEVLFSQQKIYQVEKNTREGAVTNILISRNEVNQSGEKREYPWYVEIQNGTGLVAFNSLGGHYCKKGSYKQKKKVSLFLDDKSIFCLFSHADTVIKNFEQDTQYHRRDVENFKKLAMRIEKMEKHFEDSEGNKAA